MKHTVSRIKSSVFFSETQCLRILLGPPTRTTTTITPRFQLSKPTGKRWPTNFPCACTNKRVGDYSHSGDGTLGLTCSPWSPLILVTAFESGLYRKPSISTSPIQVSSTPQSGPHSLFQIVIPTETDEPRFLQSRKPGSNYRARTTTM
jgi:hypothetical protein